MCTRRRCHRDNLHGNETIMNFGLQFSIFPSLPLDDDGVMQVDRGNGALQKQYCVAARFCRFWIKQKPISRYNGANVGYR
jgi:hypothetical protein